jgi:glucose 1-dehydrogenase
MSKNKKYDNNKRIAIVTGLSKELLEMQEMKKTYKTFEVFSKIIGYNGKNVKVLQVAGDISEEKAFLLLIEEIVKRFGRIDVLVNNAGVSGESKKISEITSEDWDQIIDINLKCAFLCTREALKHMILNSTNTKNNYSIINISSVHESIPQPDALPYTPSKGGMEMLTKNTAMEVADKGICVNGIAPGAIATDLNKDLLEDEQKKKQKDQIIPLKRIDQLEE